MRTLLLQELQQLRAKRATTTCRKPLSVICRPKHSIALQLNDCLSPQFGGIAAALVSDTYASQGIEVSFLPMCVPGQEMMRVRHYQDEQHEGGLAVGTTEQHILIPTLYKDKRLNISAAAAMHNRSPLCIASVSDQNRTVGATIAAQEDSVELLKRIFPNQNVIVTPRSTKLSDLISGKVDAIQANLTTEVLILRREMPDLPVVVPLEGINPAKAKLGYGQVVFSTNEVLECEVERKEIMQAFLDATVQGWQIVMDSPEEGLQMVQEAKKRTNMDEQSNNKQDNMDVNEEFQLEMLHQWITLVKETNIGNRLGVIVPERWNRATEWLLAGKKNVAEGFGLNPYVWN